MKRLLSIVFLLAGGALFLLGLLFVVGAGGEARRLLIAAVSLGAGAVLVGFGVRWFRAAESDSPEQVLADLLDAARRRHGEISELEVGAALGRRAPLAGPVVEKLLAQTLCERRTKDGTSYLVFKDLQPRLFLRRCEYCGAEMSIASVAEKCPKCGGAVGTSVARKGVSSDTYNMDE